MEVLVMVTRTRCFCAVAFFAISAVTIAAQSSEIVKNFELTKSKYVREHFSEGEDASSGYDYLYYKKGSTIVKIRSIWSASHSKELRIEDFYFDGDVVLFQKFTSPSRQLNILKSGRNVVLTPKEELRFAGGKLSEWKVAGKSQSSTDPKWGETEKAILEHAYSVRDYYKWLKEGKF